MHIDFSKHLNDGSTVSEGSHFAKFGKGEIGLRTVVQAGDNVGRTGFSLANGKLSGRRTETICFGVRD